MSSSGDFGETARPVWISCKTWTHVKHTLMLVGVVSRGLCTSNHHSLVHKHLRHWGDLSKQFCCLQSSLSYQCVHQQRPIGICRITSPMCHPTLTPLFKSTCCTIRCCCRSFNLRRKSELSSGHENCKLEFTCMPINQEKTQLVVLAHANYPPMPSLVFA